MSSRHKRRTPAAEQARIAILTEMITQHGFEYYASETEVAPLWCAVQARTGTRAAEDIESYATKMRAGAVFPPMVITEDRGIVIGKTTWQALKKIGRRMFPVLVLRGVYYEGANPAERDSLDLLDADSNRQHGDRPNGEEADMRDIETGRKNGWSDKVISNQFGIPMRTVSTLNAKWNARQRFELLGMNPESLDERQIRTLGEVIPQLNHGPWKALVNLTEEFGLNTQRIREYAKECAGTHSDEAGIEYIASLRERFNARGAVPNPREYTPWEKLNLALRGVVALDGKEYTVLHREPVRTDRTFNTQVRDTLTTSIRVLQKVLGELP